MQKPNVILGCYAKLIKFIFQTKTLFNAIWNNHMSCYTVMQIGKYLWFKPQQVHIVRILKLAYTKLKQYATQNFELPLDVHRIDAK